MSVATKKMTIQDKLRCIIAHCSDCLEDYACGDEDELYFTDKMEFIIREAKEVKDLCYEIVDEEVE